MEVVFNTATSGAIQGAASCTVAHTVAAGSNRALWVWAVCWNSSDFLNGASVSFGGASLGAPILALTGVTNATVYVWQMAAPPVGAANAVVTPISPAYLDVWVQSASDVDQALLANVAGIASTMTPFATSPATKAVTVPAGGACMSFIAYRNSGASTLTPSGVTANGTPPGSSYAHTAFGVSQSISSYGWAWTNGSPATDIISMHALPINAAGGGGTAPSITTNPSNQSVAAGATATFAAAASGSPTPTYQWQRNPGGAGSFADIAGAVAASYTTPATTVSGGSANNGDTYRCVATNASGSATTTAATLTVSAANAPPTFPGPSITDMTLGMSVAMSPVNVSSKFNDTDALTFSAVGSWPPGLSVSSAGVISGTPTSAGAYTNLKVRATDTASQTVDSNTFTITISASAGTLNFQAAGMEFGRRSGLGIATFSLDASSNYRYTVHANALTLGSAVYSSGVVATDAAGKLPNLTDASLVAGTTYRIHAIRQADGEAATFRMVAA